MLLIRINITGSVPDLYIFYRNVRSRPIWNSSLFVSCVRKALISWNSITRKRDHATIIFWFDSISRLSKRSFSKVPVPNPQSPNEMLFYPQQMPGHEHACHRDILLCRRINSNAHYSRVRSMPYHAARQDGPSYVVFQLCKEIMDAKPCSYGDNCTFAQVRWIAGCARNYISVWSRTWSLERRKTWWFYACLGDKQLVPCWLLTLLERHPKVRSLQVERVS